MLSEAQVVCCTNTGAMDRVLEKILPKLKFDGRFLVSKGLSPGPKIGIILKEIEDEWVTNDFEISSNRVIEIINSNKY